MLRRAIPLFVALLFPTSLHAAPVPPQPKSDDSVSRFALWLLEQRKIQKDLKMTAEQRIAIIDGLADIEDDFRKKLGPILGPIRYTPLDEYVEAVDERTRATKKLFSHVATQSLSAGQRARLRQLSWHARGPTAFTEPQVAKKLQLTDAQKKNAADIAQRLKAELSEYSAEAEGAKKQKEKLFAFRKDRLSEMEKALTADQKTAWVTMLGDAPTGFDVDEMWLTIEKNWLFRWES